MKKGDKLYIEGRIEYRQWQDKDGQTRYSTEINVRELLLLGGRREGFEGAGGDTDAGASFEPRGGGAPPAGGGAPRRQAAPAPAPGGRAKQPAASNGGRGDDDFSDFPGALEDEDDDLPF